MGDIADDWAKFFLKFSIIYNFIKEILNHG